MPSGTTYDAPHITPPPGLERKICHICGKSFARRAYAEALLEQERGELGAIERQVLEAIASQQTLSQSVPDSYRKAVSFGDRGADRMASFGGSWTFMLGFMAILIGWTGINVAHVLQASFDPYPFILLNLVLSSRAALQAPIIVMNQRRQEEKDRLRAENDYRVNLKTELQKIQIDLLEENVLEANTRGRRL